MNRKLLFLLGAMLFITLAGAVIIIMTISKSDVTMTSKEDKLQVVTTFYPVYLIGLNVTDGMDDIEVKSLTDLNTGCLHDYQLTTEDMRIISKADILVINGGGMEGFLEDIRTNYPKLTIIDSSQGIAMLENEGNEVVEAAEEHELYNPHVWLDPKLYIEQIENIKEGMIAYIQTSDSYTDGDVAILNHQIEQNTAKYVEKITKLDSEIDKIKSDLNSSRSNENRAVIFHDSFAYLAKRVGIEVDFTVPLDSDTALSAGDIASIIDAVHEDDIKYLFTEEQYSDSIARQIEEETGARVSIIDSVVTGEGHKDSYITAMEKNIGMIKDILEQQ